MKYTYIKRASLIGAITVAVFATGTSMANAIIAVDVNADTETNVNAQYAAVLEAAMNTAVGANVDAEVGANTSSSTNTSTSDNGANSITATVDTKSTATLQTNANGVAVVSSGYVVTGSDLEVFAHNMSIEHEGVKEVDVSQNNDEEAHATVKYTHSGRLFGILPVTFTSTTVIESDVDGNAVVNTYVPWWVSLATDTSYDADMLSATVSQNVDFSADTSANVKAQTIEQVIASIEMVAKAKVNANAQAEVN